MPDKMLRFHLYVLNSMSVNVYFTLHHKNQLRFGQCKPRSEKIEIDILVIIVVILNMMIIGLFSILTCMSLVRMTLHLFLLLKKMVIQEPAAAVVFFYNV